MSAATARPGSGLSAACVKLFTRSVFNSVRITKKGRGRGPALENDNAESTCAMTNALPVDPDADSRDPRRQHLADVVGDRRVLLTLQRQDGVAIADVEHVKRRDEADRPDLDRTLDVEVDVLVGRESVRSDA